MVELKTNNDRKPKQTKLVGNQANGSKRLSSKTSQLSVIYGFYFILFFILGWTVKRKGQK